MENAWANGLFVVQGPVKVTVWDGGWRLRCRFLYPEETALLMTDSIWNISKVKRAGILAGILASIPATSTKAD